MLVFDFAGFNISLDRKPLYRDNKRKVGRIASGDFRSNGGRSMQFVFVVGPAEPIRWCFRVVPHLWLAG